MRLLVQRILAGKVTVSGEEIAKAGPGLCLFFAAAEGDSEKDAEYLADKALQLRIFEDDAGKLNRSLLEVQGEILVVSEFTLYGDCAGGRRPSFSRAAPAREAEGLYHYFIRKLAQSGLKVAAGKFQAKMTVSIVNDGPVTFIIDSPQRIAKNR